MAQARIFQKGNNVQIVDEATGDIIALIPSRSFRFEPQEQYDGFVIRDYEAPERVRQYLYSEALDETGTPIGGESAVIDYLAPLVGFNPAGGGGGEANTTSNVGGGEGLALAKSGVNLPFKTLVAGPNISFTPAAQTLTIDVDGVVLTTTAQDVDGLKTFLEGEIVIDSASRGGTDNLLIGFNNTDAFQGFDIRRSGVGGVLKLMSNATFPQLFIGSETNVTGEAYIDIDNNRRMNLNVLDTGAGRPGPVRVGQHGLQGVGISTAVRDSGDLDKLVVPTLIFNTTIGAYQWWDGTNWNTIENKQFGEYFIVNNAVETVIAAVNTPVKATAATSVGEISADFAHSANRLTYNGTETRTFKIDAAITALRGTGSGSPKFAFYIALNGAVISKSKIIRDVGGNAQAAINAQALLQLSTNDIIEVWVENTTDTANLLIEELNLQAIQVS